MLHFCFKHTMPAYGPQRPCELPGSLSLSQLGIQLPFVCSVSAENDLRLVRLFDCKAGNTLLTCIQLSLPIMAQMLMAGLSLKEF